ncbi:DNA-directed RNA polymerase III subunit RPC7 isoform X1 [Hyperolius riggenbachi]|uniref:DNA-directed RNA polymerase III subunit RPC7 isoform X1 n=1 Tax=Hyperolius riggenbachi TaxID=752182 RepID=UPI0035A3085F
MAGKGRGRGSAFTFDIQSIGFSRGDALPETQLQPLPRFPHTEFKAAALPEGEEQDYLLALKQEMRGNVKKLAYYIKKGAANQGVERYITKYEIEAEQKLSEEWLPDWRLLPTEMKAEKKIKKRSVKKDKNKKPNINVDVLKKIEELEKKGDGEKSEEENEEKKKGSGDEEEEEAVEGEVEEEELEDENDYIASYFEDGDDFCASDDNMDEATY